MEQASRTALGAAMHRAAHQLLDVPPVFTDPLALRIIGARAARSLRLGEYPGATRTGLRAFVAVRSRFAEDGLAEAHARGIRQYVLLGAGLDTFAYRGGLPGLTVFEVDHPATQAWKRARLGEAGIAIPGSVAYAAVDFEREPLEIGLTRAGFDAARPGYFAWLGVTPYLTHEAIMETLGFVAGLGRGGEIAFDYAEPLAGAEGAHGRAHEALASRVAAVGEPFRCELEPTALAADLRRLGFSAVDDLGPEDLNARYLRGRGDGLRLLGRGRLVRARV
jgi:methyltransferase (TIGR00027 family)